MMSLFETYEADGCTIEIHTGNPFRLERVVNFLDEIGVDRNRDSALFYYFAILEGCIKSADWNTELIGLCDYWNKRNALTLPERFELFEITVPIAECAIIVEARNATISRAFEVEATADEKKSTQSNGSSTNDGTAESEKATKKETAKPSA